MTCNMVTQKVPFSIPFFPYRINRYCWDFQVYRKRRERNKKKKSGTFTGKCVFFDKFVEATRINLFFLNKTLAYKANIFFVFIA